MFCRQHRKRIEYSRKKQRSKSRTSWCFLCDAFKNPLTFGLTVGRLNSFELEIFDTVGRYFDDSVESSWESLFVRTVVVVSVCDRINTRVVLGVIWLAWSVTCFNVLSPEYHDDREEGFTPWSTQENWPQETSDCQSLRFYSRRKTNFDARVSGNDVFVLRSEE